MCYFVFLRDVFLFSADATRIVLIKTVFPDSSLQRKSTCSVIDVFAYDIQCFRDPFSDHLRCRLGGGG